MSYGMGITAGDLDRGYGLLPSASELMSQGPGQMDIDPMAMSAMGGGGMGMLPNMGGAGAGEGAGFLGELQKMKDQPTEDVSWMEQDEEFKNQEKQQQFHAMLQQFQGAADQQQGGGFTPPYASPGFQGQGGQGGGGPLGRDERWTPPWQRQGTRYHDLIQQRRERENEDFRRMGYPQHEGQFNEVPAINLLYPDLDREIDQLEGTTPIWGGYYGNPYVSPEGEEWFSPPAEPEESFKSMGAYGLGGGGGLLGGF